MPVSVCFGISLLNDEPDLRHFADIIIMANHIDVEVQHGRSPGASKFGGLAVMNLGQA